MNPGSSPLEIKDRDSSADKGGDAEGRPTEIFRRRAVMNYWPRKFRSRYFIGAPGAFHAGCPFLKNALRGRPKRPGKTGEFFCFLKSLLKARAAPASVRSCFGNFMGEDGKNDNIIRRGGGSSRNPLDPRIPVREVPGV